MPTGNTASRTKARPKMYGDRDETGRREKETTPHPERGQKCPCPLLKFAPYFPQNLSLSKKTLEICEICLGKYGGETKPHQENFGKRLF